MRLSELLVERKPAIIKGWMDSMLELYHKDTRTFLVKRKDQFANPIGHSLSTNLELLYELLLENKDLDAVKAESALDELIRVRSIQDFSSSDCVSFIFLLKDVVHQELENELKEASLIKEFLLLGSRIDRLMLLGFDIHMRYRERIYKIKADTVKRDVAYLLKKTGFLSDIPEWDDTKPEDSE